MKKIFNIFIGEVKNMYLKIFLLIMLTSLPINSFANPGVYEDCYYETGDRISISVFGQVSKDIESGIFSYSYTVKSNPQSEQDVWKFRIILPEKGIIINATAPLGWGGTGWSGKTTKYSHLREIKPPYRIGWTTPEGKDIKPLETVSGFMFQTSFGLPDIIDYYAEGNAPLPKCPEGMAVDFIPGYDDLTPFGPGIVGKTIGPTAPPADFKPLDFLNYIIDLKHQAVSLGWITNKGIENSLDVKLDGAKKKLEQGNVIAAKNILEAFINEVEAQKDKHLTSEAYALMKYNAQYLMEKIQ